jgi:Transcriptional regulators
MGTVPTIKDVAAQAGVSVTTVSRYLNSRGPMSLATKAKIESTMTRLGYTPNEVARSLHRNKTNIIGLIVPTSAHPFLGELCAEAELRAYESDYKVLLCNSRLDRKKERDYVEMLKRHKVDGIVMASQTGDVEEFRDLDMPVVAIDRKLSDDIPYVTSDNYAGGALATRRLIARGCRKLAYFSGNLGLDVLPNQRCEAFLAESKAGGAEAVVIQTDKDVFDFSQYERLVDELFTELPDVDGVFASDVKAAHVIQACRRLGKRVPEDVKIVGYDDIQLASLFVPRLTTVHQPIAEMGRRAVELLVDMIAGKSVPMANVLPVCLVLRESA